MNSNVKKIVKLILISISFFIFFNVNIVLAADIESQDVEDGVYQIKTEKNTVLDVVDNSTTANTLIGIWSSNNQSNQKFKIVYQEDGYYTIQAVNSSLRLEISGSSVIQNKSSNNDSQKWKFESAGDDYYYIISVSSGLYLTADGGSSLKAYEFDSNKSQKFSFSKLADLSCTEIVEEGYYVIKSALNTDKALDVANSSKLNEANIQLYSATEGTNQIFQFIYDTTTGSYVIKSVLSGKVFDIYTGSKENEANLELYTQENSNWQKWVIIQDDEGYYSFSSVDSGLFIDITGGNTTNGTNAILYTGNGGKNQKFILEKVEIQTNEVELDDGFYQIQASTGTKVVDINNASTSTGATAIMWKNNTASNQRFKIVYNSDGYYTIENVNSGLYLDVEGTTIKQEKEDSNAITQRWIVLDAGDGYSYLISYCSGLYLTFDSGTGLSVSSKTDSSYQKFKIIKNANLKGTQTIADGYYIIESAIDTSKVLDVEGASINNEANVLLWTKSGRNNQKFKITYDGNGYYTITSVRSGKSLDVYGGRKENETNIQQYTSSGSAWQKWIIEENEDGTYSIISANSGLYIDVRGNQAMDGTNIQTYIGNGGTNQKFVFESVDAVEGSQTIADGYYKIKSSANTSAVWDISDFSTTANTNVALWSSNNGYNQRFKITYRGNGYYTIKTVHSGMALTVSSNYVKQSGITDAEEQEWVIKEAGNGSYYIISAHNELYCDSSSGTLQTLSYDGSSNQMFIFESVEVETGSYTISDNKYQISTALDSNKIIDISDASESSGANVVLWGNSKQTNQKFNVVYQGDGYYKIINVKSGKALAVDEIGSTNLVNVSQYDSSDSITQKWFIKSAGDGYYNIISACNGLYLDVTNASTDNGTNIIVYTKNNSTQQKFKFTAVVEVTLETGYYGSSGLKVKGDSRGSSLKYYKIGNGPNVFFATFAVHGWEDSYSYDGQALTAIAEAFKNYLIELQDESLANNWTIYIFPSVNPDGEYYGYTHNGPGRTSLYSASSTHQGIDINRTWSTDWTKYTTDRNYNGTASFQAYEAQYLRDFLLSHRATSGQTVLVDLHGWLNETLGDSGIGSYYRSQYGMNTHVSSYGKGYLINWARSNLGYNGVTARSCLVELPWVSSYSQVTSGGFATKYINATLNMLRSLV